MAPEQHDSTASGLAPDAWPDATATLTTVERPDGAPTVAGRSFREAMLRINGAQKPGAGVPAYTRWVNRRLARYAAAGAYRVGLTPNAVSAMSSLFSLAGIAMLLALPGRPTAAGIAAAACLVVGYVLDSADGQVARLTGTSSATGEWLDHVLDSVRAPATHLAVAIGALQMATPRIWLSVVAVLFALVVTGQFMSQMLAGMMLDKRAAQRVAPWNGQSWLLLPTDTGVMCWIFVLWGAPALFGLVYTVVVVVNVLHAGASMGRRYRELRRIPVGGAR